jgi:hypothetical protein
MAEVSEKKTAGAPSPPSISSAEKGHVLPLASDDDAQVIELLGYKPELQRNRSMVTLLFQSLAIAAIPYGEGGPLISAIYGGGQLSIFVGWIGKGSFIRSEL